MQSGQSIRGLGVLRLVRELVPVPLIAALFAALSPGQASAIVHGEIDHGTPAVAALSRRWTVFCSATLIAPRVLITAAHCFRDGSEPVEIRVSFDGHAQAARVLDVRIHPGFDPETLQDDLALVLLERNAPVLPLALATRAPYPRRMRIVGYGAADLEQQSKPRAKRTGTVSALPIEASATRARFTPAPAQACVGDSGGPTLARSGGRESIIAVISGGAETCVGGHFGALVQAYSRFIRDYLRETGNRAAAAGARCFSDDNCAAGVCHHPKDAPRRGYCVPRCRKGECPSPMACDARTSQCLAPLPSPGALGTPCAAPWDCGQGTCASPNEGGPSRCAPTCLTDVACARGYRCGSNVRAAPDPVTGKACFPRAPDTSDAQ